LEKLLASSLLPLLELAAAAEHAVLPMLAVLELAVAMLPVLELATVVASVAAVADPVATVAHHASSHVSSSHVSTSHVPTVAATRDLVCSIGHGRSSCSSSQHAAHATTSMATTVTRRARVTGRGITTLLWVTMLLGRVTVLLRRVTMLLGWVTPRSRWVTPRRRRVPLLWRVSLRRVSLLGRISLLRRVPVATRWVPMTASNTLHQVGHEPFVTLVMVVIASSHLPRGTELEGRPAIAEEEEADLGLR